MQSARKVLDDALERAAQTVVNLMERPGRNAMTQLAAARDILDRGGLAVEPPSVGAGQTIQLVVIQAGAPALEQGGKVLDITALVKR